MGPQGGDSLSSPNITSDMTPAQQPQAAPADGGVPINVINAVNANGIVSGEKLVIYAWKRIAICLMVLLVACGIGIGVAVFIANKIDGEKNQAKTELAEQTNKTDQLYAAIGATDQDDALAKVESNENLNGGDLQELADLLKSRFGAGYVLDIADANINFVRKVGAFRVVSLGVRQESGTVRVVMYERLADGVWKMSAMDGTEGEVLCEKLEGDDKSVLETLKLCMQLVEDRNEGE